MINYQLKMENIISNITSKPTLLLHACCAPCSSAVIEMLNTYFNVTIFYYNPNITNESEYLHRFDELKKFLNHIYPSIELVEGIYNPAKYLDLISPYEEKEGGKRCYQCYLIRLEETAKYAYENNFDYFTTTLSISPYKNSNWINEIGEILQNKYNIKYLYADFKKKNGYLRSIELSKKYHLYRQNYCGCEMSKKRVID